MFEVTKEDLERANKYWENREKDVWEAAEEYGFRVMLENKIENEGFDLNGFLFELFDNGDAALDDVDIALELKELFKDEMI